MRSLSSSKNSPSSWISIKICSRRRFKERKLRMTFIMSTMNSHKSSKNFLKLTNPLKTKESSAWFSKRKSTVFRRKSSTLETTLSTHSSPSEITLKTKWWLYRWPWKLRMNRFCRWSMRSRSLRTDSNPSWLKCLTRRVRSQRPTSMVKSSKRAIKVSWSFKLWLRTVLKDLWLTKMKNLHQLSQKLRQS